MPFKPVVAIANSLAALAIWSVAMVVRLLTPETYGAPRDALEVTRNYKVMTLTESLSDSLDLLYSFAVPVLCFFGVAIGIAAMVQRQPRSELALAALAVGLVVGVLWFFSVLALMH